MIPFKNLQSAPPFPAELTYNSKEHKQPAQNQIHRKRQKMRQERKDEVNNSDSDNMNVKRLRSGEGKRKKTE